MINRVINFISGAKALFLALPNKYELSIELRKLAVKETAEYVIRQMQHALRFDDKKKLLEWSMSQRVNGLVLEFGVYKGTSLKLLANLTDEVVHGFDSFLGLQEDWAGTGRTRGSFSLKGKPPSLGSRIALHVGWFEETLPGFISSLPAESHVSFVHIDCDTFQSTSYVLEKIREKFTSGTIIVFDEYMGFHGWKCGEFLAFRSFVEKFGLNYSYIAFSRETVAVKLEYMDQTSPHTSK